MRGDGHHFARSNNAAWDLPELVKTSCRMADAAGFPRLPDARLRPMRICWTSCLGENGSCSIRSWNIDLRVRKNIKLWNRFDGRTQGLVAKASDGSAERSAGQMTA